MRLIISSFMNFLICLIRLILVCVIKMFIQNLSLAHIMALVVPSQLFTFKSVWFEYLKIQFLMHIVIWFDIA